MHDSGANNNIIPAAVYAPYADRRGLVPVFVAVTVDVAVAAANASVPLPPSADEAGCGKAVVCVVPFPLFCWRGYSIIIKL